ncbi:MAG: MerR family transcriptional regulator [Promicromonosporaceae bacterium]|nr:MerR family transcriptional regulator [Promicromonosporaceae bacterium]
MEVTIQEVARLAGVTSRTLRHYQAIGLLEPSSTGHGGLRHYGQAEIVRLQRILLLRGLGMSLTEIARAIDDGDAASALEGHRDQLRADAARLARQIESVERTLAALREGRELMAVEMLDGFDHTEYREEVEARWGADAYQRSHGWWRGLGEAGQAEAKAKVAELNSAWAAAARAEVVPDSDRAQELAARHLAWLASVPGTPRAADGSLLPEYVAGLGEMYVADERFAANYGGSQGAALVRDALAACLARTTTG